MKHIVFVFISLLAVNSLGSPAIGADIVLSVTQVTKLFSNRTMTIKQVKRQDEATFKVFTASNGVVRSRHDDKGSDTRTWKTSENGRFCFSRTFRRQLSANASGATCGFIVSDGSGSYRLYQSKNGQLAGVKKNDLLLIFSRFTSGNAL